MSVKKDAILIISTDAHRTGTPILLLELFKWVKSNSDKELILIFQEGGELILEFEKISTVYLWDDVVRMNFKNSFDRLFKKVLIKTGLLSKDILIKKFFNTLQEKYNIKLVYNNSARNGHIVANMLPYIDCKILTQVHEGEKFLQIWDADGMVTTSLNASDAFVVVSNYVKFVLENTFGITKEIKVIPGGVTTEGGSEKNPSQLRMELDIPENAKVLLSCGWLGWHKGTDFFIQLARKLGELNEDIYLIWLGGSEGDIPFQQMQFDIDKLHLNKVKLVSNKKNVNDYFGLADIFLMLSREESFSLVTAEAGRASKPVLCFDSSGGPYEIVGGDKRFIIPYGNVDLLYARVLELLHDAPQRQEMGDYLRHRIIANYTIEKIAPQLLNTIEQYVNESKVK